MTAKPEALLEAWALEEALVARVLADTAANGGGCSVVRLPTLSVELTILLDRQASQRKAARS